MKPAMSDPGPPAAPDPIVRRDAHGELSLWFDDETVQSRTVPHDPARLVLEYSRLMMGFLLFRPAPARIAMIGLGGGSLARYCALKLPDADFTAVEISPAVIALRDRFGVPPDGPRFRVVCADGADFVRRDGEAFDVLLVDGFDRDGQPERLSAPAFYDACRGRLAAGGVLVVNLHSGDAADGGSVDHIDDAFAGRRVVLRGDRTGNMVVIAGADAPFPPPFGELVRRRRVLEALHPIGLDAVLRKIVQGRATRRRARRGRLRRR